MIKQTNMKRTKWLLPLLLVIALALYILLSNQRSSERSMAVTEDMTVDNIAEQFFWHIVERSDQSILQNFRMTEDIRSWVQTGKYRSAARDFRRMLGSVGKLQKKEIVQHEPQLQFVELFFSGKTNSFKVLVSFQENQIAGIRHFPWNDESTHGGTPIQLETPTGIIHGTLLEPEQATEPVPVVLILAGSGPTDRNGNQLPARHSDTYRMIAEALQQNDIASVRFDKRGIGASSPAGMEESDMHFEHYIEDAVGWLERVSQENKYSKIIVMGHSEGSLIGMLACIQSDKADGFISLCGAGRPVGEVLCEQMSRNPQSIRDAFLPILDEWEKGNTVENVPADLSLARPSVQPYMISWLKYDPRLEIKKLTIPILIVQGTTDIRVSKTDAENLLAANPQAKKVIIKGMNHTLKNSLTTFTFFQQGTYTNPKYPLHKDLMPSIVQYITALDNIGTKQKE